MKYLFTLSVKHGFALLAAFFAISLSSVAQNTNNVYFFVGSPLATLDATVELSDGAGYYQSFVTSDPWGGEFIADVPFGTYTYTISKACHETVTGSVEVDANDGQGVSVFANLVESSTNNVYFFVGSPFALLDATVELSDGAGYYQSFVTSDLWGGEYIADVPYGTYTYTISKSCYETITGSVDVVCNDGMGVSVFATPVELTLDMTVTSQFGVLSAVAMLADYQWVDCDAGNSPVMAATGATFAPSNSGTFAVQISVDGCMQQSSCVSVSVAEGCTYDSALNYNALAVHDDGSCEFAPDGCAADLDGDGTVATADLLSFLTEFGAICN